MLGRRRREAKLAAIEEFRQLRRIATEDVTVLGEQLAELHVETLADALDDEARRHYQQALDGYERAKEVLAAAESSTDVVALDDVLDEARFQRACVLARRDGDPLPDRRDSCFFNPQHGPSRTSTTWSPPGGTERPIEVCASCAQRLAGGQSPDVRLIRVGDRYVPWWQAGGSNLRELAVSHTYRGDAPYTRAHAAEAHIRAGQSGASGVSGPFGPYGP